MNVIIVGCGNVGYTLVEKLRDENHNIVVVDQSEEMIDLVTNEQDVLGVVGDGVDYNDNGIQAVAAAVTGIFNTAMDNDHRYVLPDSTEVTVPKYADIPAEDKAVRNLPDVKATFSIQASIHTVKTVELQVVA